MENKKKLAVDVLYMLGFMSLIASVISSLANFIFLATNNEFLIFYNLCNCLLFSFSFVCLAIMITNFFLKEKFDWIEIALFAATLIMIIVMLILSKDKLETVKTDSFSTVYKTYIISFFTEMTTFIILIVSKLLKMFYFNKKDKIKNAEVKNEEK